MATNDPDEEREAKLPRCRACGKPMRRMTIFDVKTSKQVVLYQCSDGHVGWDD